MSTIFHRLPFSVCFAQATAWFFFNLRRLQEWCEAANRTYEPEVVNLEFDFGPEFRRASGF